ncbi:MAG: helix-turn-helix transcriptional regulator [Gammaproteobacteria bacterium]
MDADNIDTSVSKIAAAIAEPARTRMLYSLMDGHARTSTELAIVAEVSPSTASVHLARLKEERLVKVLSQGKYRYYTLENTKVAAALESLRVVAGGSRDGFVPNTPIRLRTARTCYDHMAGTLAVALHDRCLELEWLSTDTSENGAYDVTQNGTKALESLGMNIEAVRTSRRRFAYACLDWSERRPHIAGAIGACLLEIALNRKWVVKDLDSRALNLTQVGRREFRTRFGLPDLSSAHSATL